MTTSHFARRIRVRRRNTIASVAVATLAASLMAAAPAESAPQAQAAQDPQCAEAYPVDGLVRDMPVTGLTVSSGTTPEPFTGSVLGVLEDGIAPGLDLIMVRLTSPEIDRVGVWAGMSGSPVYAEDGRLIGAVSYGLALGPSPVAGVTPAADMQALLDGSSTPFRGTTAGDEGAVPRRVADRLVAHGAMTKAEAGAGFDRLPLPMAVSGMSTAKRLRQFANHFDLDGVRVYRAGGVSAAAPIGPAVDIVAGGNVAVTLAYGDLTAGGVGTATQVCGDEVIAFGHPAWWDGPTTLTMHSADAIYVQEDPTLTPYKVANITAPVGSIIDDRLAGIHGYTGVLPESSRITSHVVSSEGPMRDGETVVTLPEVLPDAGAFHLLANIDRVFDGAGEGSSRVRMTVEGVDSHGVPFDYSRSDRYASGYDISWESIFESYWELYQIQQNGIEEVTITDIDFRAFVDRDYREYQVSGLKMKVGGRWVNVPREERLLVRSGQLLSLRVGLRSLGDDGNKTVDIAVRVPAGSSGKSGTLRVVGGSSTSDRIRANSLDELLSTLEDAPHNDDVLADVTISRRGPNLTRQSLVPFTDVVRGALRIGIRVR